MIALQKPLREPAKIVPLQTEPRCVQCHDPLPVERAAARKNASLCTDCALDGMPHTD